MGSSQTYPGPPEATVASIAAAGQERRIVPLDGLRGLMTILVIVSHYFGELPHGVRAATMGWLAVDMFFVLSGYLIGRLILDRKHHANFFAVFYLRRFCRLIPAYLITVLAVSALLALIGQSAAGASWADAEVQFPLWAYLSFNQNFFMISTGSIGAHWLAPTWTLVVEEHFYLLAPALIVFIPNRRLVAVLTAIVGGAVLLRAAAFKLDLFPEMAALVLLPCRADLLVFGVLAAIASKSGRIAWHRLEWPLRVLPIILLLVMLGLRLYDQASFDILFPLLVAACCAASILTIVHGAPEAKRLHSRMLRFFGNNGYCLYLTHLPVLGLMHGLILGAKPDLATPAQWLVTAAALPVCTLVGWGMTRLIEEPLTAYGRSWRWSSALRPAYRQSDSARPIADIGS